MSNKFIREGIEDFNWVEDVESGFTKVDTTKDYMGVWPQFEKMLSELGVTNLEGEVVSYDDEGTCKLLLKSDYFEFEVHANFDYIETNMVSWSIQNVKNYGYVKDEYSLDTNDWLKPIVDKLKEMIINSVNKYKKMNESEDFEWISDIDAKLPTLGELFDDGRLEVDDIITLRGEVINGRDWKKKWFNEFVIELTSKGERLTSGTFFDLIDTPINNGVSESMGLSSDFEISFIDGDEKLEVLGVVRNGKEMDLFKLNESNDFDWIRDVEPNISFHDVRVGEKYNIELTDEFYGALNDCFGPLEPFELMGYKRTTNVRVIGKDMAKHTDVYCYSENNNEVISLHLAFYNDNGEDIADHFWVTEEMANLYPRTNDLNESDGLDWIREIGLPDVYVGAKFKTSNGNIIVVYETDEFWTSYVVIDGNNGKKHKQKMITKGFIAMTKERGLWEKIDDETPINESESDDFDWVRNIGITNHIKPPYFKNMKEYGLSPNEYNSVLSKIFNQPVKYGVTVQGYIVYDKQGNKLYRESSVGDWIKREYDEQGNRIYYEDSDGKIKDYRNLNESDDFDWIKDIDVTPIENTGSRCDVTYDLVYDYFSGKRPIVHGNYTYYMDSTSGVVIWEFNDTDDYIVYATPFWEGNCYLPINIQGDMGDYEELVDLELPKFNYREELFNWLENVYPNIVASAIDDLGPLPE